MSELWGDKEDGRVKFDWDLFEAIVVVGVFIAFLLWIIV